MKAYVIPVQEACNAKCIFCITKYRKESEPASFGNMMDTVAIRKLYGVGATKIEITGGGEPLLHPKISEIINDCSQISQTQLYTNGEFLDHLNQRDYSKLKLLCISRHHHDNGTNSKLMGRNIPDTVVTRAATQANVKLSLVLCRGGIEDSDGLKEYLAWANQCGVKNVVVRQMFDYSYSPEISARMVPIDTFRANLDPDFYCQSDTEISTMFQYQGMSVELEKRTSSLDSVNVILRPNGILYRGWGSDALG